MEASGEIATIGGAEVAPIRGGTPGGEVTPIGGVGCADLIDRHWEDRWPSLLQAKHTTAFRQAGARCPLDPHRKHHGDEGEESRRSSAIFNLAVSKPAGRLNGSIFLCSGARAAGGVVFARKACLEGPNPEGAMKACSAEVKARIEGAKSRTS